jgi:hypothetical protein
MKLSLMNLDTHFEPAMSTRKKAVDHFKKCPSCGNKELHEVGPDLICFDCCWDSTAWDVSQGGMDYLFVAAKEFGLKSFEVKPQEPSITTLCVTESESENYLHEIRGA